METPKSQTPRNIFLVTPLDIAVLAKARAVGYCILARELQCPNQYNYIQGRSQKKTEKRLVVDWTQGVKP